MLDFEVHQEPLDALTLEREIAARGATAADDRQLALLRIQPRLVFADWLEENGNPSQAARGELLRVQCELARWVPDLRRRSELQERERQLIADHRGDWLGALQPYCLACRFERGLAHVTMSAATAVEDAALAASGADWFRAAWVDGVRFLDAEPHIGSLFDLPALVDVCALDLSGNDLASTSVHFLTRSPNLSRLTCLNLSNNRLSATDVSRLLMSSSFARLREFDLRNNLLVGSDAWMFLSAAARNSLQRVDLHGNTLDEKARAVMREWHKRNCPVMDSSQPTRFSNDLDMEFARIPAGTFLMGAPETEAEHYPDELPQHPVTVTRSFYLGVYPVTQRQYQAVMHVNPADFNSNNGGSPDHPVDTVSWHDAVAFCRRLSDFPEEKKAGRVYRLPTEAEWEHACRAGSTTPFHFGAACSGREINCDGQYPYGGAPHGPFPQRSTKVGTYEPNAFGLFDTHGNVWEWCADWYDRDYYRRSPVEDPQGPPDGDERVLRGGSWFFRTQRCRSAARLGVAPEGSYHIDGFRVALVLPTP